MQLANITLTGITTSATTFVPSDAVKNDTAFFEEDDLSLPKNKRITAIAKLRKAGNDFDRKVLSTLEVPYVAGTDANGVEIMSSDKFYITAVVSESRTPAQIADGLEIAVDFAQSAPVKDMIENGRSSY